MADPIGEALRMFSQQALTINAEIARMINETMSTMAMFAPHNVLQNLLIGSGYYSAKLSTSWLNEHNIY